MRHDDEGTGAHVALMIGARVVAGVASAVIGLLVPRMLGIAEYGDYGLAFGIATTLVVLSDLGLTSSLARAMAEQRVDRTLLRRVAIVRAVSALVVAGGLAGVGLLLADSRLGGYLLLAGAFVVTSSMLSVAMGLLPTLRRVRALFALTVAQPLLELAAIVVALLAGYGGSGVLVASTAAAAVTGTAGLALVARSPRLNIARAQASSVNAVARYGGVLFLVGVAFAVFGVIDQLVIYAMHGAEEAAGYIATWRLVTLLHLVGLAAATIVAPRLAGGGASARALFDGWLRTLATAYVCVAAIAAALASVAVPAALGPKYQHAGPLLVALSGYVLLLGVAPLVTMAANFLGGGRQRVRIGFVTIGLNLALDLLLVPWLGAYGAAIGTTVAFSWYVAAHLVLTWRLLGPSSDVSTPRTAYLHLSWMARPLAAAATAAGAARIALELLVPATGDITGVLVAGLLGCVAAVVVAWGHPRNAAPRVAASAQPATQPQSIARKENVA